ncbi:MAG: hypothetical protein V1787_02235 [Candidatus Micrarchaeota archaeon]
MHTWTTQGEDGDSRHSIDFVLTVHGAKPASRAKADELDIAAYSGLLGQSLEELLAL